MLFITSYLQFCCCRCLQYCCCRRLSDDVVDNVVMLLFAGEPTGRESMWLTDKGHWAYGVVIDDVLTFTLTMLFHCQSWKICDDWCYFQLLPISIQFLPRWRRWSIEKRSPTGLWLITSTASGPIFKVTAICIQASLSFVSIWSERRTRTILILFR